MEFRNELFVSRALRNPVMRGCPVCLREDARNSDQPATAAMVMRGGWLMREANICIRHDHPFVELWTCAAPRDRFDIAERLAEIENEIMAGTLDQPSVAPTACDTWLDGRLQDGRDETWFKGHSLFATTTFRRVLGQALLLDRGEHGPENPPHSVGFALAEMGERALREALGKIAFYCDAEPSKANGAVFVALNRDYTENEDFEVYRRILLDVIQDHWPIGAGEELLGERVPERRMHSLKTASQEIGIGPKVIEHFFVEAGRSPPMTRTPLRAACSTPRSTLVSWRRSPRLSGQSPCERQSGQRGTSWRRWTKKGILRPRTQVAKVKNPWRLSDGKALIAELSAKAQRVGEDDDEWETLLLALKRSGMALSEQVEAIRGDRLALGQREGVPGFHGFVVPKRNVDHLLKSRSMEHAPTAPAGAMSAACFGRSVGLRDNGYFLALIEAGHTPATPHMNRRTGRRWYFVTAEEISAFHRRFVTLTTLCEETGLHRNTLKGLLDATRVARFTPDGQDFGAVFLRNEAARALR